jgi:hypothetical protein
LTSCLEGVIQKAKILLCCWISHKLLYNVLECFYTVNDAWMLLYNMLFYWHFGFVWSFTCRITDHKTHFSLFKQDVKYSICFMVIHICSDKFQLSLVIWRHNLCIYWTWIPFIFQRIPEVKHYASGVHIILVGTKLGKNATCLHLFFIRPSVMFTIEMAWGYIENKWDFLMFKHLWTSIVLLLCLRIFFMYLHELIC